MGKLMQKIKIPHWVVGILFLTLLLRVPSFFEPYYYGDEMIYMTLGQGVKQGLTLYKDVHDNKPPLIYWIAAISENLFVFKAILCFWNLFTIVIFYKLAEKLFSKNESIQKISVAIFAILTTIPIFEGNIVNAELFMIGFSLVALLILLSENLNSKKVFLAGFLFGMGTLFKIPAAFDAPVIVIYWLIIKGVKNWREIVKDTFFLSLGFVAPILITFVYYFFKGALPEYMKAAFLQNVGYLSSFRPGDVVKPFYIRNAPLLIRAGIVSTGLIIIFIFRQKLSKNFILICVWILVDLFAVTLSERPYPHYFIQIVAPISFLLGMLFAGKNVSQSLVVIPLALTFFVPVYYKFYYYSTFTYYSRFMYFALGKVDKETYFSNFAPTVNRNYKIADFLVHSSNSTDRVFMWDPDSAIVYALSRRLPSIKYVADYHVGDYSNKQQIANEMITNPPKFIVLTSNHPIPEIAGLIKSKYLLVSQIENANIYVRTSLSLEYQNLGF
jgi:hypothetical protein